MVVALPLLLICAVVDSATTTVDSEGGGNIVAAPLLFDIDETDPHLVAIYWNQNYRLKKVKEISSREIHYLNDSESGEATEEVSDPWQLLLVDEEDTRKVSRFVLLRHEPCREKDFRVSWYDQRDQYHGDRMVRLGPSPIAWKQNFTIAVSNLRYDSTTDTVSGHLQYDLMTTKRFNGKHVYATIDSVHCDNVFNRWMMKPNVDRKSGRFVIPLDYMTHNCQLKVRLNMEKSDARNECWQLYRTDDEHSEHLNIVCEQVTGLRCPIRPIEEEAVASASKVGCRIYCRPTLKTQPIAMDSKKGKNAKPSVKVNWTFDGDSAAIHHHLIRTAEVDYAWNNNPIAMFNATANKLQPTVGHVDLPNFSKIGQSFYTFQACAVFDDHCSDADIDWEHVPKYPIYVTNILQQYGLLNMDEPAEETTTTTTEVATTTAASKGEQQKTQKNGKITDRENILKEPPPNVATVLSGSTVRSELVNVQQHTASGCSAQFASFSVTILFATSVICHVSNVM